MSDTTRYTQPGWGPNHPWWCFPEIQSDKHQKRDRRSKEAKKRHKFVKGLKNTRHNLLAKIDALKLEEAQGTE